MKATILLAILLGLIFPVSYSQINCATEITQQQIDFQIAYTDSVNDMLELNRTFSVSVFVVEDEGGLTNFNMSTLTTALSSANSVFDPIKISFTVSSTQNVENYHFDSLTKANNENDLVAQNFVPNTINLYLVSQLVNDSYDELCGYTYYPGDYKDVIILKKSCVDGTFLIEQLGHFFNLYHTHETEFDNELVDASNCTDAGDWCCDTYADPNLSDKVNSGCIYASTVQDAKGQYYAPSVNNYMSFSLPECKCFFSKEQYIRIVNCILKDKSHLW